MLNIENIKKVRDVIADLPPERFDMRFWSCLLGDAEDVDPSRLLHDCGTCGCIGGWGAAVLQIEDGSAGEVGDAFGLRPDQVHPLFFAAAGMEADTAQAVATLDHLMATGEVDWNAGRAV